MQQQDQLELGFAGSAATVTHSRRENRLVRAQWWFGQMRRAVDQALDWRPAPPPRSEQIWFGDRQVRSIR